MRFKCEICSKTKQDAVQIWDAKYVLTVDLVARGACCRVCGGYHVRSLQRNGDHEIMNLLEVKVCHDSYSDSITEIEMSTVWMS